MSDKLINGNDPRFQFAYEVNTEHCRLIKNEDKDWWGRDQVFGTVVSSEQMIDEVCEMLDREYESQ